MKIIGKVIIIIRFLFVGRFYFFLRFSIINSFIFLLCFFYFFGSVAGPCWNSWMKDLIPEEKLGSFFSHRTMISQIINVAASLCLAFFIDYIVFWTFIGIVLLFLTEILNSILDSSKELVLGCILVILLFWQATPWKQMSLNRCHIPPMINPFGLQSVIDCFSYGLKKAFYCVGTCWPLMWISLVTMQHTMYLMPLFTFMMYFEQNLPWKPEQWRIPYLSSFDNFYKQLSFKQKNSTHPILRFDRKF